MLQVSVSPMNISIYATFCFNLVIAVVKREFIIINKHLLP